MTLAIFDLDNTLLGGDSDYLWGEFLAEQGLVDREWYARENHRFYEEYKAGTLNIMEFLSFSLRPLAQHDPALLMTLHRQFMAERIQTVYLPAAAALLAEHRAQGHLLMIITATNRFVTAPIAEALGVDVLIATDPEMIEGRYTGRVSGIPTFQHGKVERLNTWMTDNQRNLRGSWFYSDSHNDLPLLEMVDHPVAVDPDETLINHAQLKGWPIITLRKGDKAAPYPLAD